MGLDGPLGVFADAALGKMLEVEAADIAYHRSLGASVERPIGATCVVNRALPHPAFNAAFGLDAEGQDATAFVHQVELTFGRAGVPFEFVCTPITRPPDLADKIAQRGYSIASRRTWMELMLAPPTMPDDPRIDIRATTDAWGWAATVAAGLEAPSARELLGRLGELTLQAPGHALLHASYLGQAAGACEVSVDEGIAFIRRLVVRSPYHSREVARALLHTACEHAYASDAFRVLTRVFGGTGAEPLFESHGFVGVQISDEYVREFPPFLLD